MSPLEDLLENRMDVFPLKDDVLEYEVDDECDAPTVFTINAFRKPLSIE